MRVWREVNWWELTVVGIIPIIIALALDLKWRWCSGGQLFKSRSSSVLEFNCKKERCSVLLYTLDRVCNRQTTTTTTVCIVTMIRTRRRCPFSGSWKKFSPHWENMTLKWYCRCYSIGACCTHSLSSLWKPPPNWVAVNWAEKYVV